MTLRNLAAIVSEDPSLHVVATAQNGVDALQQIRDQRPHVVIMDLYLPGEFDGVEAIRRIQNLLAPPVVVAATSFDLESYTRGALDAGAVGFILKNDAETLLTPAIHATATGDPIANPQTTTRLSNNLLQSSTCTEIAQSLERIANPN